MLVQNKNVCQWFSVAIRRGLHVYHGIICILDLAWQALFGSEGGWVATQSQDS